MAEAKDKPSQLALLQHDVLVYRDLMLEKPGLLAPLGDLRDKDRQNLNAVVADLYWLAIHHAMGVVQLLQQDLRSPLVVVLRALYETVVSLRYVTSRPDPIFEALVYRAYSFLLEVKFFPDDKTLVADRHRVLAEMPQQAVQLAKERVAGTRGWSGQNMRSMAENAGFSGYELYAWLSEEGHSRVIGQHVRLETTQQNTAHLCFGSPLEESERENMANFARRMLNHAFASFWRQFSGDVVNIQTTDPHKWSVEAEVAS